MDKHQVEEETFFFCHRGDKDDGDAKLGVVRNEIYFLYKIKRRNQKFLGLQKKKSIHLADVQDSLHTLHILVYVSPL